MLAIVQFSSIAEDGRRGLPATRSLRTEQRFGRSTSAPARSSPVDVSGSPADRGL